jgi:hypothetical protein
VMWPRNFEDRGPSPHSSGEGSIDSRILIDTAVYLGGVEATAR